MQPRPDSAPRQRSSKSCNADGGQLVDGVRARLPVRKGLFLIHGESAPLIEAGVSEKLIRIPDLDESGDLADASRAAGALGVNPDALLMAVAIGALCAFLTPVGHQNDTLILGPGGFRFGDYWRLGLPTEALIVALASPPLLIVWPL